MEAGRVESRRSTSLGVRNGEDSAPSGEVEAGPPILGKSPAMQPVFALIRRVADLDVSVFITGESGTGKELVARQLHARSNRGKNAMITVNCAAVPESLLETELFGHTRGAFTGARGDRKGLMEEADGGTFFLDEIADIGPAVQSKLLRVLQDGVVKRVGSNFGRPVDLRFIAATNKNLESEVERGTFREDLYYRLKVVTIRVPPLRERGEDIAMLIRYFFQRYVKEMQKRGLRLNPSAESKLRDHPWPGNVRELENRIKEAVATAAPGQMLGPRSFASLRHAPQSSVYPANVSGLKGALREFERGYILDALSRNNGNKSRTARELRISRQGLFNKLHRLRIPL